MTFDYTTLVTDRTAADVTAKNAKGAYIASDLNRVNAAMEDLRAKLIARGYANPYVPVYAEDGRTEWEKEDTPTAEQLEAYLANVRRIRESLHSDAPLAPASMRKLSHSGANDIEEILLETEQLLPLIDKSMVMSGEAMAENPYFDSSGGMAEAFGAVAYAGESVVDSGAAST